MKKYLSILAFALVLALSVTACSSSDKKADSRKEKKSTENTKNTKKSKGDGGNILAKSAANTQKQDSVEIEGVLTLSGNFSGAPINGDLTFNGKQSFKTGQSEITMDMTPLFASLGGGGVAPQGSFIIETRTVDGYTYTKAPSFAGSQDTWVKAKLEPTTSATQDPTDYLNYIKGASDDFKTVGKEEIKGVSTTHYEVTLDPEKFKEQIAQSSSDVDKEELKAIEGIFSKPIIANVWVGKDGLVRKLDMTIDVDAGSLLGASGVGSTSGSLSMKVSILFSNYGDDVKVVAPPANQITIGK